MVSRLLLTWQTFQESLKQAGIRYCFVPLSFDAVRNVWWTDYPTSYCNEKHPSWLRDRKPHLVVTLRIDNNGFLLFPQVLHIDHLFVSGSAKKRLREAFAGDDRFSWNGSKTAAMEYRI